MTTDNQQRPRLRRSSDDRMIGGVCGGVAEFFGLDVILWLIVPKAPKRLTE